jgi:hypothetical protein
MLLLRVLRADFFGDNADFLGDCEGALNEPFAIRPSAMLSLLAMVESLWRFVVGIRDESTDQCKHGRRHPKQCGSGSPRPIA